MKRVQIAVRGFALPIPRIGSIEVHSGYGYLPVAGDQAHRQIQQKRGEANPKYKAEQKISHSFERGGFIFNVAGRIDGLIESDPPYLEEIKTAFDAKALYDKLRNEPDHPYCLQLKTYAYIYAIQNNCTPACALIVGSYANDECFELQLLLNTTAYERWLDQRLDELVTEAEQREAERQRRKAVGAALRFPFLQPRTGQLDLVATIERAMLSGDALMVQAPTGMGKTAGVIFPMLKDSLERGQKLIYVTPKNSQHQVAEAAAQQMRATWKGDDQSGELPALKTMTLTAKAKLCPKGEPVCNPQYCEFARDYYAKVYEHKLVDKVAESEHMDGELFTEIGKQYEVCPFELSVDSIHRADLIIGDYNYAFAPQGLIGRFTGYAFGDTEKPNLVIDEAHNLPARACDYFSPAISSVDIDACREKVDLLPLELRAMAQSLLHQCFALLASYQPKGSKRECKIDPSVQGFEQLDIQLSQLLNSYLQIVDSPRPGDPILALCRRWSEFTQSIDNKGEEFFATYTVDSRGITLKITCCDASQHLAACTKEFEHVVAFSATLKPFDYYARLCGFDDQHLQTVEFQSPFPADNRKLLVIPQVSTKYADRSRNYGKIAQAIEKIVGVRKGNYFVFFPSFAFLRDVFERTNLPEFDVLQQKPNMTNADVQKFIEKMRSGSQSTVIFAVQGGVFSEGVDYPGDMLIGAIIVGPSLPGYDLQRELMREYYEKRFGQGFDYAYTYPAMARVVQAAGRVIRSESDRGLIVLMDRRFTAPAYTATMPADWFQRSVNELVSHSILTDISNFWNGAAHAAV